MNDNLITEIIDLNKVKANLLELQKMWEQLIVTMASKSSKDLKFDNLAQNLKTVTTAEAELVKVKQGSLNVEKELDKKMKEVAAQRKKESDERIKAAQKEALEVEKAAQKEAAAQNKAIENTIKLREKESQKQSSLTQKQIAEAEKLAQKEIAAQEKAAQKKQESINKNIAAFKKEEDAKKELIRVANQEITTLRSAEQKLKAMNEIYKDMPTHTAKAVRAADDYKKKIDELDKSIRNQSTAADRQKREIGNYPKAADSATASSMKMGASFAAVTAGITIAIAAVKQMYGAVKESIDLFIEQEKQSFRVGQAFGDYAGQINAAADANQAATTVGNEQYQKLAVLAKSYGAANKDVNDTVKLSIGLSTQFEAAGIGQEQALKMIIKAQNGQYSALKKVIPAIGQAKNQQEAMNILNEAGAKGYDVLTKYAATYGGRLQQLKNITGDLKEELGSQVMEGILGSPESINDGVGAINNTIKALTETKIIAEYLGQMREQAMMMLEPFKNIFKILGEGGDATQGLITAFQIWMKYVQFIQTPIKLFWSLLASITGAILDVKNAFTNFKEEGFSFQKALNIINKAIVELLSPISDLVGMSDEVSKFFGVQTEKIKLTAEEYGKLNVLSGNYFDNVKKAAKEQTSLNAEIQKSAEDLEEEKKALEEANKQYLAYLEAVKKANEEAKLSIGLGENRIEVRKKEVEAIYSATKAYFELNGYTDAEISKLKELQAEIDKLNLDIENAPNLIDQKDIKALESTAKITGEISTKMRNVTPAINDVAGGFDKLDMIFAKVRNTFNDFFGTKPIEDWRDTFKDSVTQVVEESLELYNQVIELQTSQLDQQLENIDNLYNKQVSALESTYDRRKALLTATISDEEELAAALARIEEEKTAVQNKFQDEKFKKEQDIAKKKAILEKKKAAMEVAAGSASALVEAVKLIGIATTAAAPGDPYSLVARIAAALAASLTVVGAVVAGIAKVKAIEIPQFFKGGEAQEGQIISVAERGKELAVGESGKSYMFDKQSVIVAPEKMRIFSNKETNKIMEKQTINNTYEKSNNVNLTVNIDNERHKKYFKLT